MQADEPTRAPSSQEQAAFADSRSDRDATLEAVHRLEAAAGTAGSGREVEWLEQVAADLQLVEEAVARERAEAERPDSLLSMIARDYPRRFGSRIRQLRDQHEDVGTTISSLREQLEAMQEGSIDIADVRQRLAWLAGAIRHRWAREADLVFEALRLDLGRAEPAFPTLSDDD
jgi:hypothetical protein